MANYRVRDLLLVPNLLSGARLPLAVAFPFAARSAPLALGVLGLAGATDVLDGWTARKLHQATPMGALVDGFADKIFAVSVLGTLVVSGRITPVGAVMLATRELAELPLAIRILTSKRARLTEVDRRANTLGKVATVLEFTTVLAVLMRVPGRLGLLAGTAVVGAAAGVAYWLRELHALTPNPVCAQPRRVDFRRTTRS